MLKQALGLFIIAGFVVAEEPAEPFRYLSTSVDDTGSSTLRTAVKVLKPQSGKGPTIHLVSASHIGESAYYTSIQKHLATCDLVLYEGVGVPLFKKVTAKDCKDPTLWTRTALLYLRDMAVWYREEMGKLPDDLKKVRLAAKIHNPKEFAWVDRARTNGWGKPIAITVTKGVCTIQSLGRDGLPGGKGPDADLLVMVSNSTKRSDAGGLQRRLANSLGMHFQLDAIDYSKPRFVNSDISIAKLRELSGGKKVKTTPSGQPAASGKPTVTETVSDPVKTSPNKKPAPDNEVENILSLLQGGNPAIEWIAAMAEGFLSRNEKGRETVKWILCETLAAAENFMEDLMESEEKTFAGTATMMRILLRDRNAVVMADLERYLKARPELTSVAIFYGAAHMRDLERRIRETLAYTDSSVRWLTAFRADPKKAGITEAQAETLRQAIEKQLKAIK